MQLDLSIELEVLPIIDLPDLVSSILCIQVLFLPNQSLLQLNNILICELLMQSGIPVAVYTILSQSRQCFIVCERFIGLQPQYVGFLRAIVREGLHYVLLQVIAIVGGEEVGLLEEHCFLSGGGLGGLGVRRF
ncbi:hypothetical protein FGO68_gene16762 [Halteria grandinella]|uniref:Uncharacterized protein n=1 Tax=Halteria grandinella TaxID=5974 RepID=A0A8J8NH19_HALGN|nr:hypothetical protein FGO68_gene16762 [Halteria grandinella]